MLTRLKLTRGEGQIVEPSSQLSRRTIKSPQASRRYSPSMAHEESHGTLPSEEETFIKDFYDMTEMVKCNVPDLASLGNVANVCVGSKVYNI